LKLTRLAEVMNELTTMYNASFSKHFARTGGEIKLIRESGAVAESLRDDPVNAHIQITSVTPFFGFEEQERERIVKTSKPKEAQIKLGQMISRDTLFDKAFNLNCFMYETPFTREEKKAHYDDDSAKQWKRQTFLFLENNRLMPFVKQRMVVVSREQVELTPIENAIDTVNLQTSRLHAELKKPVPDVKSLQPLLQGSCLVMVQKGMVEGICSSFLGDTVKQWPRGYVARLIISTENFVKAVEDGLRLHQTIVPSEMEQMHMELEKGFRRLRRDVTSLITKAREECEFIDDADLAKAAKIEITLKERITPAPQFISSSNTARSERSEPSPTNSSPIVSLRRTTRPLQRRMSVNISPLVVQQVTADFSAPSSERSKRKRADSVGGESHTPNPPAPLPESSLMVSVPVAIKGESASESDVEEDTKKDKEEKPKEDAKPEEKAEEKKEEEKPEEKKEEEKPEEKKEEEKPEEKKEEAKPEEKVVEPEEKKEVKSEEKKDEKEKDEESDSSSSDSDTESKKDDKSEGKKKSDDKSGSEKKSGSSSRHSHSHHHHHSSSHHSSQSPHPRTEEPVKHHREKSSHHIKHESSHVHSKDHDHDRSERKSKPSESDAKLTRKSTRRSMRKSCIADPVHVSESSSSPDKKKK